MIALQLVALLLLFMTLWKVIDMSQVVDDLVAIVADVKEAIDGLEAVITDLKSKLADPAD